MTLAPKRLRYELCSVLQPYELLFSHLCNGGNKTLKTAIFFLLVLFLLQLFILFLEIQYLGRNISPTPNVV
jgi:hypothetical protein